jgi:hypothetical protein
MDPVSWLFLPPVLIFSLYVQSDHLDLAAVSRMRSGFGRVHSLR